MVIWNDLDSVIASQEEVVLESLRRLPTQMVRSSRGGCESEMLQHTDVLEAINRSNLKPTVSNRTNKIDGPDGKVSLWVFGAWVKRGLKGITAVMREHPNLTKALTPFLSQKTEDPFLAIVVSRDVVFKPHRDPNDVR